MTQALPCRLRPGPPRNTPKDAGRLPFPACLDPRNRSQDWPGRIRPPWRRTGLAPKDTAIVILPAIRPFHAASAAHAAGASSPVQGSRLCGCAVLRLLPVSAREPWKRSPAFAVPAASRTPHAALPTSRRRQEGERPRPHPSVGPLPVRRRKIFRYLSLLLIF